MSRYDQAANDAYRDPDDDREIRLIRRWLMPVGMVSLVLVWAVVMYLMSL